MEIVPFGKYKGKPVEALQNDRQYVDWLTSQDWFVSRYPQINQIIINNFGEPSETPEHNYLQAKFTDDDFVNAFLKICLNIDAKVETVYFEPQIGGDVLVWYSAINNGRKYENEILVEIKPTISDDYPAILRQVKNYKGFNKKGIIVLYDKFSCIGASLEQVKKMFSPIRLISIEDIR